MVDPVDAFHLHYYDAEAWRRTRWLGVEAQKCPLDLWIYQELLFELRPDLILETGTMFGGSALFLASICDLLGHGEVVSVDLVHRAPLPQHPRLQFILGSSTDAAVLEHMRFRSQGKQTVMAVLDSDHSFAHVLAELEAYQHLVTPGSMLIVEDTNVNGNPILPDHGPGPREAVAEFLRRHDTFRVERQWERQLLTFNAGGFLRRIA